MATFLFDTTSASHSRRFCRSGPGRKFSRIARRIVISAARISACSSMPQASRRLRPASLLHLRRDGREIQFCTRPLPSGPGANGPRRRRLPHWPARAGWWVMQPKRLPRLGTGLAYQRPPPGDRMSLSLSLQPRAGPRSACRTSQAAQVPTRYSRDKPPHAQRQPCVQPGRSALSLATMRMIASSASPGLSSSMETHG